MSVSWKVFDSRVRLGESPELPGYHWRVSMKSFFKEVKYTFAKRKIHAYPDAPTPLHEMGTGVSICKMAGASTSPRLADYMLTHATGTPSACFHCLKHLERLGVLTN
mgnify:CR=1 FL=1